MILLTYFLFKNHLFFMGNPIITMPYTSSKMQTFYFIFKISPLTFSPLTFSILKVLFSTQAKMWEKNEQVHLLFWKYCFWPKPKCRRKINRYIYYFKNIVFDPSQNVGEKLTDTFIILKILFWEKWKGGLTHTGVWTRNLWVTVQVH